MKTLREREISLAKAMRENIMKGSIPGIYSPKSTMVILKLPWQHLSLLDYAQPYEI